MNNLCSGDTSAERTEDNVDIPRWLQMVRQSGDTSVALAREVDLASTAHRLGLPWVSPQQGSGIARQELIAILDEAIRISDSINTSVLDYDGARESNHDQMKEVKQ
jgi:hypothetical protein